MGLVSWYKHKRNSILDSILTKKSHLSDEWETFLKRDTYLTSDLKEKFLEDYSQMFHWLFLLSKKVRITSKEYNAFLDVFKYNVQTYNEEFIEARLKEFKDLFDGKDDNLKFPLDDQQRRAIVIDDKHNLVIAGAGAGKTEVLTSKIAYLVRRQDKPKIIPEKILVLAFNNSAIEEIKRRMANYGIKGVDIKTYHKLGYDTVKERTGSYPALFERGNDEKIKEKVREIIDELLKNKEFQDRFLEYLSSHLDEEENEVSFDDKVEYYNYMRNKRYITLKNEKVSSISERDIANFFFTHNIKYEYEKETDWIKDNEQEYKPDFYLPEYEVYIEHWGLSRDNKVPEWFKGENPTEEYLKNKEWKIAQFEKYKKKLVQSWDYDKNEGNLISKLIENLKKIIPNIPFSRLSYEEIVNRTNLYRENKREISEMIFTFINLAKANGIYESEIVRRTNSNDYKERQRLFGKVALEVFRAYQKRLNDTKTIDFNNMIIEATDLIKNNPQSYKDRFDYILVDEFQDVSKPKLDLITALLHCNSNTKLFCVGDDWQSINGFAGSEVEYFVNFKNNFKHCQEIPLKTNYRSSEMVVKMSNQLISNNKNKISKEIVHCPSNGVGSKAVVYELPPDSDEKYRITKAIQIIRNLQKNDFQNDILVLSRFNRILKHLEITCQNCDSVIPVEQKSKDGTIVVKGIKVHSVHSSKGLQAKHVIILDVNSGTYGFPSEIRDSSVLEIARNSRNKDTFEEERRLFYVALTRSKDLIHIITMKDSQSIFLNEIKDYLVWQKI